MKKKRNKKRRLPKFNMGIFPKVQSCIQTPCCMLMDIADTRAKDENALKILSKNPDRGKEKANIKITSLRHLGGPVGSAVSVEMERPSMEN